ncbi:MAG: hypothetical protein ACK5MP_13765 [Nostocoides sp.]
MRGQGNSERGATGLEYVGMFTVAAMVVAAITFAIGLPGDSVLEQRVCEAISKVMQTEGACSGGTGTPEGAPDQAEDGTDFEPQTCTVGKKTTKSSSKIKIAFFEFGEDAGFIETTYSDGHVEMTATNGGQLGLTAGLGADASSENLKLGAKVDFGGGVTFDNGSTWSFANQAEADAMRSQLDEYLVWQYQMTHPSDAYGISALWASMHPVDPPKPPNKTISTIGSYGDLKGTLGLDIKAPTGPGDPITGKPIDPITGQPSGPTLSTPGAGVFGSINQTSKWTKTSDTTDGSVKYTGDITTTGDLSHQLPGGSTGGSGGIYGSSVSVTYDKSGNLSNISFVTTAATSSKEGASAKGGVAGKNGTSGGISIGGDTTDKTMGVVTTSLDLDPTSANYQEQLNIVNGFLGGDPQHPDASNISMDILKPDTQVPGNDFQNLLFQQAKVSLVQYDNVSDGFKFAANVKVGVALGIDVGYSEETSTASAATYLGPPRTDGTRAQVPYTDCVGG